MLHHTRAWARWLLLYGLAVLLAGCGGGRQPPLAARSDITITGTEPGPSPHVQYVLLHARGLADLAAVGFRIQPKTGARARPVSARYAMRHLLARRWADAAANDIRPPVFGLYAGTRNEVAPARLTHQETMDRWQGSAAAVPQEWPWTPLQGFRTSAWGWSYRIRPRPLWDCAGCTRWRPAGR